ncbi:hypothetical protein Tsubulata_026339 [Turnera subulata]|uniref:Myb/SANT-like domain-containing protein n=1 Tax=Turnera subulata TaxID=218843 RepID=A0A9Q0FJ66_9ROSI|nr:hypothetical protein Tsubulata_026339 [Turnera subulata]
MGDKPDRRQWTKEEVDTLIYVLEDLVVGGFKADAGQFKPGTYGMILAKIKEKIPDVPAMNENHVRNKMKKLRERYTSCYEMLQCSGFAWDDVKQCVAVDSIEVLSTYKKKNPKAKYQAWSPFPEYERLCHIFGHDHATGVIQINQRRERGKCLAEQQQEQQANETADEDDGVAPTENVAENATESHLNMHHTSSASASDASVSTRRGKRAREIDPFGDLVKTMKDFVIDSKEEGVKICETMAEKKHKGAEKEEQEIDELEAILNELERLQVPMKTVMGAVYRMQVEPKHIKLFWRLRDSAKVEWAEKLASV